MFSGVSTAVFSKCLDQSSAQLDLSMDGDVGENRRTRGRRTDNDMKERLAAPKTSFSFRFSNL